jgi:hypothetical protein
MIIEALEVLQLNAPEAHVPGHDRPLDFDFGRLEHQLAIYLGPHPSWEDPHALTFSFVNIMMQLVSREPLYPDILTQGALAAFPYSLCNAA